MEAQGQARTHPRAVQVCRWMCRVQNAGCRWWRKNWEWDGMGVEVVGDVDGGCVRRGVGGGFRGEA